MYISHMYLCTHIHTYMHMYIRMYVYIYTYAHTYTCICTLHICMYISVFPKARLTRKLRSERACGSGNWIALYGIFYDLLYVHSDLR